jgi:hypothetical protein
LASWGDARAIIITHPDYDFMAFVLLIRTPNACQHEEIRAFSRRKGLDDEIKKLAGGETFWTADGSRRPVDSCSSSP